MPLTEQDPNTSGRTSRASNMSTASRSLQKPRGPSPQSDLGLLSTPGVMSMLRSSTELGDIGGLAYDSSSLMSNVPRGVPRRMGASSRMSTGSSRSNASRHTPSHQAWTSASSGARRSLTSNVPQYIPDTLSPTIMNLPGSSPLIPRSQSSRHAKGRSRSLTNTSHPTFGLSSNRSFASLQAHEHMHRPRSPYRYPTRLRRPSYRPLSPASSDTTGTRLGRSHEQLGLPRMRTPSGTFVGRSDRSLVPGHHIRDKSALHSSPYCDVPPVPPLFHHMAVEQARKLHRSTKGSTSSGSTNQRTESDAPSSDAPGPPTPKGDTSMGVLVSPIITHALEDSITGLDKNDMTTTPLYYDYSEQFERNQNAEPESTAVPAGFVHRIKTILEERATVNPTPDNVDVMVVQQAFDAFGPHETDIAELPASPVPRRITREIVLAALDPSSTTDEVKTSTASMDAVGTKDYSLGADSAEYKALAVDDESVREFSYVNGDMNRYSTLSEANMSLMDSSTLKFAVRCSIPMATDTEDGMSDLLDGYQHTETKLEGEDGHCVQTDEIEGPVAHGVTEDQLDLHRSIEHIQTPQTIDTAADSSMTVTEDKAANQLLERRSNHTQKSSDEQSFKSCTDMSDGPNKDADAKSFKTCKDAVTPKKSSSLPVSRLPSMDLAGSVVQARRPVSEMPLSSPKAMIRKPPAVPPRESSFSKPLARLRASSKVSSRQGSTTASISSSVDITPQQPLAVPHRESSLSKEALRTQAVGDFLLRLSRPHIFSRVRSGYMTKAAKEEPIVLSDKSAHEPNAYGPKSDKSAEPVDVVDRPLRKKQDTVLERNASRAPEKPLVTPKAQTNNFVPADLHMKPRTFKEQDFSSSAPALQSPPLIHQPHENTLSPVLQEPSTVYSSEKESLETPRSRPSAVALPKSTERSRRDSQTTTHLVWHGRRSLSVSSAQDFDSRFNQNKGHDDTTTDLRLSAYRYPLHYLPDLKEESHEDSSLNTSASNLKNSTFRFPLSGQSHVGQASARMSADESGKVVRRLSTASVRKSRLAQTRGLPSMNFSSIDLFSKLNEAFDMPPTWSMDSVRENTYEIAQPSPMRPVSTREIREKYRSFFASLDEFEKASDTNQVAKIIDLMPLKQQYSPDDLVAEIDSLTIPSVGGLTQRLSEFLPSIKEFGRLDKRSEFVAEEIIMEHALEELQEVGGPAQKRSSARLRPVPGSPNLVVIDDGLYEELTGKEKENVAVPASPEEPFEDSCGEPAVAKRKTDFCKTRTHERNPSPEIDMPAPVVLRTRSQSLPQQDLRNSLDSKVSSRRSLRSTASTPTITDTRPWNSDKNYPWATTIQSNDISLPTPAFRRGSSRPGPSPLRARISESSDTSFVEPTSPASPTTIVAVPGTIGVYTHARHRSRRLSFFSHSRRATNVAPPGFDASGFPTGPIQVRGIDQTHEAGERYPTSALTPPVNATLVPSNSRSRWSDESSDDDDRPVTSRKLGFGMLKSRLIPSSRAKHPRVVVTCPTENSDNNDNNKNNSHNTLPLQHESYVEHSRVSRRDTFMNAKGMSSSTFHGHRILEKIRRWWHRGSDLVRNLTGRHRQGDTPFPPNVEDSAIIDGDGRRVVPLHGSRGVALWTGV